MGMLLPALAIGGLTFGPYIGRLAYQNYKHAQRMATTEMVPMRDVRPSAEAEVAGVVATDAETFPSPVSETPTVCCVWRVDEWSERGKLSIWRPIATGVRSVPFELADEFGHQLIDVGTHSYDLSSLRDMGRALVGNQDAVKVGLVRDNLTLDLTDWYDAVEVPPDEAPPPAIEQFIEDTEAVTPASDSITNVIDVGHKHGRRRYREALLTPGDPCYALGMTDTQGMLTPEAGSLLVGSGDEDAVLARKRKRARHGGAVAISSIVVGSLAALLAI